MSNYKMIGGGTDGIEDENVALQHRRAHQNRKIFQGDSFSLLLFCSSRMPLTNMLNKRAGYEVKEENKVSHLCYMDDFKLFSRYKTKLQQDLTTVKTFTNGIRMQSGIDKCTTAVFKHGKITKSQTISLNSQTVLRNMELDKT